MKEITAFREALTAIAERSRAIKSACLNEESTKLYLILPVITALGYDCADPYQVQPEYFADFRLETSADRADFVILHCDRPSIVIECKSVGTSLAPHRGQLRAYFSALQSVRLGVLTNGLQFEFFVDAENTNIMDSEPFVTLDLEQALSGNFPDDVIHALLAMTRSNFDPEMIAEVAELRLVEKRIRSILVDEVREPSEDFCRLVLSRAGLKNIRRPAIEQRYSSLVQRAFQEALVIPVARMLQESAPMTSSDEVANDDPASRILTTERELAVYRYVCRRLAYLSPDESHYAAIERVRHRDYVGKFAIYYESVRKGRILDFIEGDNGYDKFVFPEPFGEIVTNSICAIDEPLRQTFSRRVRELGAPSSSREMILQRA